MIVDSESNASDTQNIAVPWTGLDVFLFIVAWLTPLFISVAVVLLNQTPDVQTEQNTQNHRHPIVQLIEQSNGSLGVFLIVFCAVVVVTPLIEEFLFRMLLQGWLEATFKRSKIPYASGIAIGIVSLFFAAIHIDIHNAIDVQALIHGLVLSSIFSAVVFIAGITYLTQHRNVRIAEYLFCTKRMIRPRFFTCAGCCLLVILFCFILNATLTQIFPGTNVAPISIFCFSLALGVLYSRTQNLADCVLLHACLNGISLMAIWLDVG